MPKAETFYGENWLHSPIIATDHWQEVGVEQPSFLEFCYKTVSEYVLILFYLCKLVVHFWENLVLQQIQGFP